MCIYLYINTVINRFNLSDSFSSYHLYSGRYACLFEALTFLAAWIDTVDGGPIIHPKDVNKHCNWTQYAPDNYCTPENYKMKWKKPTI